MFFFSLTFQTNIALKTQYLWLRTGTCQTSVILLTKNNKQENTDNFSISLYLTASLANEFVEKREYKSCDVCCQGMLALFILCTSVLEWKPSLFQRYPFRSLISLLTKKNHPYAPPLFPNLLFFWEVKWTDFSNVTGLYLSFLFSKGSGYQRS